MGSELLTWYSQGCSTNSAWINIIKSFKPLNVKRTASPRPSLLSRSLIQNNFEIAYLVQNVYHHDVGQGRQGWKIGRFCNGVELVQKDLLPMELTHIVLLYL